MFSRPRVYFVCVYKGPVAGAPSKYTDTGAPCILITRPCPTTYPVEIATCAN